MSEERTEHFCRWNNPVLWGIILSGIFIGLYAVLAVQRSCVEDICQFKWQEFLKAKPNEMGDTLAGVFGGLAFLWIIVTVTLQSQELSEQRKELRLATQEARRTANALTEQLKLSNAANKRENELAASELLDQRLDRIELILDTNRSELFKFPGNSGNGWGMLTFHFPDMKEEPAQANRFVNYYYGLCEHLATLDKAIRSDSDVEVTFGIDLLEKVTGEIRKITTVIGTLTSADVLRLEDLRILELEEVLTSLLLLMRTVGEKA